MVLNHLQQAKLWDNYYTAAPRRQRRRVGQSNIVKRVAKHYAINPKTVYKWQRRDFQHDVAMGPKVKRSTVLTVEQEAMAVALRKHTLLPLDNCLYALQPTIPTLTCIVVGSGMTSVPCQRLSAPQINKNLSWLFSY